jgi:hypothetical protein
VVVTLTMIFVSELPGVTVLGEIVQVDSEGVPVHLKLTDWFMPPSLPTLRIYVADCPGETAAEVEDPDADVTVKSWPVPLSATA